MTGRYLDPVFDADGLTLRDYLDALRRRWWVVVVVTVVVVGGALVPSLSEDASYASSATVRNSYQYCDVPVDDAATSTTSSPGGDEDPDEDADEDADEDGDAGTAEIGAAVLELVADLEMVESSRFRATVADRVAADGGAADFGAIEATLRPLSTVLEIRVTAEDPGAAAAAAQTAAEYFVERRVDAIEEPLAGAAAARAQVATEAGAEIDDIDAQLADAATPGPVREDLRARRASLADEAATARRDADRLELESSVRSARIEILSDAVPADEPIGTGTKRAAAVALVLGLLLGCAVAVFTGRQSRRERPD